MSFDTYLFNFIYGVVHRYTLLVWLANFLANYLTYILVIVFVLFLIFKYAWRKRLYLFSLATLAVILSRGIATELIRFFYYRPRPFIELDLPLVQYFTTGSLPSGHMAFLTPLSLLIWHEDRNLGKWFILLTLLVGLGRVAAGIHWPSDILLGMVIGAFFFYLLKKLLPKA